MVVSENLGPIELFLGVVVRAKDCFGVNSHRETNFLNIALITLCHTLLGGWTGGWLDFVKL